VVVVAIRSISICLEVVCAEKQQSTCSAWASTVVAILHGFIVAPHLLAHILPQTTHIRVGNYVEKKLFST